MDLSKIEALIEFVGRSRITELTVTERETTVRIFREKPANVSSSPAENVAVVDQSAQATVSQGEPSKTGFTVTAPIFGVLHLAPAPNDPPFVAVGDDVIEGQTLFIIEAMKVFNKIAAPRAGRVTRLTDVNGAEVEAGDVLAEIA